MQRTLNPPATRSGSVALSAPDAMAPPRHGTPPSVSTQPKPAADRRNTNQPAFALTGLVEGNGSWLAVINGDIFGVGDRVGSALVVEIAEGVVRLQHDNGQEYVLQVPR
jgi:hypothetical protein